MYCFIPIYIPGPIRTKQIGTVMNRGPKTGLWSRVSNGKDHFYTVYTGKNTEIPILPGIYRYTDIFLRYGTVQ